MYSKKKLTILIVIGVAIFLLGIALGFFYEKQLAFKKIKVESVNSLTSKLISSITAYGNVTKIEGRKITLSYLFSFYKVTILNLLFSYSSFNFSFNKFKHFKLEYIHKIFYNLYKIYFFI